MLIPYVFHFFPTFSFASDFFIPHEVYNGKEIRVECFLYTVCKWLKCTYELKGLNSLTLGAGMHAQPQWNARSGNTSGKRKLPYGYVFFNY